MTKEVFHQNIERTSLVISKVSFKDRSADVIVYIYIAYTNSY